MQTMNNRERQSITIGIPSQSAFIKKIKMFAGTPSRGCNLLKVLSDRLVL
jgi:hypothetical protein